MKSIDTELTKQSNPESSVVSYPLRSFLLMLYKISKKISSLSVVLSAIFISLITLVVVFGVIMRYVFKTPQIWVDPVSIYSMIGLTFIGASYAMYKEKHIRVDIVIQLFKERTRRIIEVFMYLIALAYTILLGILTFKMAHQSFLLGRTDGSAIDFPLYIPQILIPIGCFLLTFSIIGKISENICLLKNWITK